MEPGISNKPVWLAVNPRMVWQKTGIINTDANNPKPRMKLNNVPTATR